MRHFLSLLRGCFLTFAIFQSNILLGQLPTVVRPNMEIGIFTLVNMHRSAYHLPPLIWSPVAVQLARNHSLTMANGTVPFGHQGADARFVVLRTFIPSTTRFGENVAYNRGVANPAYTAFLGWVNSPGHLANIIGNYNYTGVGVVSNSLGAYYFTQVFFKATAPVTLRADLVQEPEAISVEPEFSTECQEVEIDIPLEWEIDLLDAWGRKDLIE